MKSEKGGLRGRTIQNGALFLLFLALVGGPIGASASAAEVGPSGLITAVSGYDFPTTLQRLEKAIGDHRLGIVSRINAQENLKKKGITIGGNQIFEVFRPDLAQRVFDRNPSAGIEIPIRIYVYENGSKTMVEYRLPSQIFQPYRDAGLDELGAELDEILKSIVMKVTK